MGRPTKLTPEVQKKVLEGLALGLSEEHAFEYAGVAARTGMHWLSKGDKERGAKVYRQFRQAVKEALPKREARKLAVIERATQGVFVDAVTERFDSEGKVIERVTTKKMLQAPQWTAAAWCLERFINPDRYRQVPAALIQNTVNAQGQVAVLVQQVRNMSDEQIAARREELAAGRAALLEPPKEST